MPKTIFSKQAHIDTMMNTSMENITSDTSLMEDILSPTPQLEVVTPKAQKKTTNHLKFNHPPNEPINRANAQLEQDNLAQVDSIFDAVKQNKALKTYMVTWLLQWQSDKESFTIKVLNFVIQACGIEGKVTAAILNGNEEQLTHFIEALEQDNVEIISQSGGNYPLISKSKDFKVFQTSFATFWSLIPEDLLSPFEEFLPNVITWLSFMSRSKMRAIRHTTTLAILHLSKTIITLINAKLAISNQHEKAMAVRKRGINNQSLQAKIQENNQLIQRLNIYLDDIFQNVLMHRYRDIVPDIRMDSIRTLGEWLREYPGPFLTSNYLKYIGWMMSDNDAKVRNMSMLAYIRLYESNDLRPLLNDFTKYHMKRLENFFISNDADTSKIGFRLLSFFMEQGENVVSKKTLSKAYSMLAHENPVIREAAAKFVLKIIKIDLEDTQRELNVEEQLRLLLNIIQDCKSHSNFPDLIVNTICHVQDPDGNPLYAWETIEALLCYHSIKDKLSSPQQALLAKFLVSSAKHMVSESMIQKKVVKKKTSSVENFTKVMLPKITSLINIFKGEEPVLESLVLIPQYFRFENEMKNKHQMIFTDLIVVLRQIFQSATSIDLCDAIISTLYYININDESRRLVDVTIREILDQIQHIVEKFVLTMEDTFHATSQQDQTIIIQTELCINRLNAIFAWFPMKGLSFYPIIYTGLQLQLTSSNLTLQRMVPSTLKILYTLILSELSFQIKENQSDNAIEGDISSMAPSSPFSPNHPSTSFGNPSIPVDAIATFNLELGSTAPHITNSIDLDDLSLRVSSLIELIRPQLNHHNYDVSLAVFFQLCTLLRSFSNCLKNVNLSQLIYHASPELVDEIKLFFEKNISTETEDEVEIDKKELLCTEFAQLIFYQVFGSSSINYAVFVLVHFIRHGPVIEECIRKILLRLKELNPNHYSFEVDTLKLMFELYQEQIEEGEDAKLIDYTALRLLAKRFARPFVTFNRKESVQQELACLIQKGMLYALDQAEKNAPFVTNAMDPFLHKIDLPIAKALLKELSSPSSALSQKWMLIDREQPSCAPYQYFWNILQAAANGRPLHNNPSISNAQNVRDESENNPNPKSSTRSKLKQRTPRRPKVNSASNHKDENMSQGDPSMSMMNEADGEDSNNSIASQISQSIQDKSNLDMMASLTERRTTPRKVHPKVAKISLPHKQATPLPYSCVQGSVNVVEDRLPMDQINTMLYSDLESDSSLKSSQTTPTLNHDLENELNLEPFLNTQEHSLVDNDDENEPIVIRTIRKRPTTRTLFVPESQEIENTQDREDSNWLNSVVSSKKVKR